MARISNSILYGNSIRQGNVPVISNPFVMFNGKVNGKSTSFGLSEQELARHILLVGSTGSGKTNTINQIVAQLKRNMKNDDVMVIFDTKGDYYNEFYSPKDTVIANNEDYGQELCYWNIFKEIIADGWDNKAVYENANEICTSLFRDAIDHSSQPFFPNAAKDLMTAILVAHIRFGEDDYNFRKNYLNNKALKNGYFDRLILDDIYDLVGGYEDLSGVLTYLGDGSSDQSLGVIAELQSVIRQLFLGAYAEDGRFSIRNFIREKSARTLFIEYDLSVGMTLTPIYRLLFDLALKEALGRKKTLGNVYVICDEFKLLPNLQHIEDAVNFGRGLGVKIIAGIQSLEQLYEIYGESKGRNIASGFSSLISFRTNDAGSRKYLSDIYGHNIVLEQYSGINNKLVEEKRIGNVIEDWDFAELKLGEAIISLPFQEPFVFQFDEYRPAD